MMLFYTKKSNEFIKTFLKHKDISILNKPLYEFKIKFMNDGDKHGIAICNSLNYAPNVHYYEIWFKPIIKWIYKTPDLGSEFLNYIDTYDFYKKHEENNKTKPKLLLEKPKLLLEKR